MSIFLFKTHPINLTNLAQTLLLFNAKDNSYEACSYSIDTKFIRHDELGQFAKSMRTDYESWRYQDWKLSLDILENKIDAAIDKNKTIIFGSHRNDQIYFLKDYFQNKITTIGINYKEDLYDLLLRNVAEYHVYLNSSLESVNFYIDKFHSINFIPKQSITSCDYEIMINDFFNQDKMTEHYKVLGYPFTEQSIQIYKSWLAYW